MGILVVVMAAVIEIALGIYCIKTKSGQKRIKNWTSIGSFLIFVLLTLISVIKWSFRWELLAAVLFISALAGGISLIRNRKEKKSFKSRYIVFKAVSIWLIIALASVPALIFPQYKQPNVTGKYSIKTALYTYRDSSRIEEFSSKGENRQVNVEFWYPGNAEGKYPLVVFSHGAFGIKTSNTSTFRELASNGYIVCSIDHPYHSMYTKNADGGIIIADRSFIQEIIDVNNGVYDDETIYKLEQKWLKLRTEDISFVLDTIIKNSKDENSEEVYRLIDTDKIGLMGHSLGGAAAAKLGRDRRDINAVINLDADLLGEYTASVNGKHLVNHSVYPVPLLSIYTDDMKRGFDSISDNSIEIPQKLISATAPNAYEVFIGGTNHMSLTDLPLFSPFIANMIRGSMKTKIGSQDADKYYVIEKMNSIVLEFYNTYLKGQGSFKSAGTY